MARPTKFNRDEVLEKVMLVFWEKGYNDTSLEDLLSVTGLSKSSLYQAFGNKHELFLTAYHLYCNQQMETLQSILHADKQGLDAIIDFFTLITSATGDEKAKGCMTCNEAIELAPNDKQFQQLLEDEFLNVEKQLLTAVERGKKDGSISNPLDTQLVVRFLTAALQGVNVLTRSQTNPNRLHETVQAIEQLLQIPKGDE
ncbi:TetR/AcrR family transcriptional regulator [Alkalihalobacillus pseudalcaliphilus]|uniref:TetR/AcrR family transcriptional regulator n=1 Tax=Alkalihalobacillus pseudalcaliphilus TaxID=79884 RepID=UPI00069D78E5|nr:TetR/AcrR family transcriptional regulator [Alkalihalobacillus pseudalcaliphilus]